MNRRSFLAATGTAVTTAVSGCLGGGNEDTGPPVHPLGETVTYNDIDVTLNKYHLANRYAVYDDYENNKNQTFYEEDWFTPPTKGGIFLLANIIVEHHGDARLTFPPVESDSEGGGIYGAYDTDSIKFFKPYGVFRANDRDYRSYYALIDQYNASEHGVFPGVTFNGWLVTEVPEAFRPRQLSMTVRWGDESGYATHQWNFGNQKPEVVPNDYQYKVPTRTPATRTATTSSQS